MNLKRADPSSRSQGVSIGSMKIRGLKHTRSKYIERIILPITQSRNPKELELELNKAYTRLGLLGAFPEVNFSIIPSSDQRQEDTERIDVLLDFVEDKRFMLRSGCEIGSEDVGTVSRPTFLIILDEKETSLKFPSKKFVGRIANYFGTLESFELNYTYGIDVEKGFEAHEILKSPQKGSYELGFSKPLIRHMKLGAPLSPRDISRIQLRFSNVNNSSKTMTLYKSCVTTASLMYDLGVPSLGNHKFGYELIWRHLYDLNPDTPWSIRLFSGINTKSAIKYVYSRETRDSLVTPSKGRSFKFIAELAGLLGNAKYIKFESGIALTRSFTKNWSTSFTLRGGLLAPLFNTPPHINDKFSLGNFKRIRGYIADRVGPIHGKYHVNGDAYWNASLSLFTPLPKVVPDNTKGHLFLNIGGLAEKGAGNYADILRRTVFFPIISIGGGFTFPVGPARLEFNYSLPLICGFFDRASPGLGINIGTDIL